MKLYKVSATFYEFIEAKSKEDAIDKFENSGGEELTLDSDTLKAKPMKKSDNNFILE